ncbi:MAG: glycosyltransferase family 2 protein [Candidatus Aminicenantes bacterium]|nr:glycosyltransferase family 2 protein [Candidatus Aminicenantes bacterium]
MNSGETKNSAVLKPGVSVIVCCYNSSDVITPTVKALSEQIIPEDTGYEVILVDNNCTDNTVALAERAWQNSCYPLRVIREKKPGQMHARITGLKNTRYEITLFVDDDNVLNRDWMKKLSRLYKENSRIGAVGGYNRASFLGEKPEWFDRVKGVYACGPRDAHPGMNPKKMFGAGLSFRTHALKATLFSDLPLFLEGRTKDALTRGDDTEIALRFRLMGWDFYYDDSLVLKHNLSGHRLNWKYVSQARKKGGQVSLILKIYRDILNGRPTLSYWGAVRLVLRKWKNYFKANKLSPSRMRKAGSNSSSRFFRLVGMSRGLLIGGKKYNAIREKIVAHYERRGETARESGPERTQQD